MLVAQLLVFVAASVALIVHPGPNMVFVLARAAVGGRKVGLISVAGVGVGQLAHTLGAALGLSAILEAMAAGEAAAVHCGGGLGRTGTLLACYLLTSSEGLGAEGALRRVRALRPGSVETPAQLAAVRAWAVSENR